MIDYNKEFININKRQDEKGFEKYGKYLSHMDDLDWLDYASEEMVDGFKYLIAEKHKRAHIAAQIRALTDSEEIHKLLDRLWLDDKRDEETNETLSHHKRISKTLWLSQCGRKRRWTINQYTYSLASNRD